MLALPEIYKKFDDTCIRLDTIP